MSINRRNFFRTAAISTAGLAAIPEILSASMTSSNKKHKNIINSLSSEDVIIFQGDSITDAGRERVKQSINSARSFGYGYALLAASTILNEKAEKNFKIYNRGISGDKAYQLSDRWQEDCFNLHPALVSILVGVNDFWHKLDGKYEGSIEKFETDYRHLLTLTTKMIPTIKLVIGEPYAIKGGTAIDERWFPEFDLYRNVAQKLADEFDAVFVPYHAIFEAAVLRAPARYWAPDGVHPSMAGSSLMAEAWLKAVM